MKAFSGQLAILLPGFGVFIPISDLLTTKTFRHKAFVTLVKDPFVLFLLTKTVFSWSGRSGTVFMLAELSLAMFCRCSELVTQCAFWQMSQSLSGDFLALSGDFQELRKHTSLQRFVEIFGAAHMVIRSSS